jgi:hypothetical protein
MLQFKVWFYFLAFNSGTSLYITTYFMTGVLVMITLISRLDRSYSILLGMLSKPASHFSYSTVLNINFFVWLEINPKPIEFKCINILFFYNICYDLALYALIHVFLLKLYAYIFSCLLVAAVVALWHVTKCSSTL